MKKEAIILYWIENGVKYQKEIEREEFYNIMDSISKGFSNDNYISSTLCFIIPDVTSITINKDRNAEKDIPFISYITDGKQDSLDIIRYHKIIWAILDGYARN